MKKSVIRIALYFATYNNEQLNSFAILVIACLKTNTLFPNLPVPIIGLTALQASYQNAMNVANQGGTINTAAKHEAGDLLISALRQIAGYIQSLTPVLTLSQVLTSGFDVVHTRGTPQPLTQPVFTLDNSVPGQLTVNLQAVANAKAYQVQYSTGTGVWQEMGIFANTRNIVLPNLTAGSVWNFRVRAVGGSTHYSDWSITVSLMST